MITVPITMDTKGAATATIGLAGGNNTIRSFEIWWDSKEKELRIILAAQSDSDLQSFKQAFANMYSNVNFIDLENTTPQWFDYKNNNYQIFDVGYFHGHYATVFDKTKDQQLISYIANTLQLYKYAWVQFVFLPYNFTPFLQSHVSRLNQKIKQVSSTKYRSLSDELTNTKPHIHPEHGLDFYNKYQELSTHASQKMQSSHILMSIRGVVQGNNGIDKIESVLSVQDIRSNLDHLTAYSYKFSSFYRPEKPKRYRFLSKMGRKRTHFQRISLFESRLIPAPKRYLSSAIRTYFEKSPLSGNYRGRKPLPFLILSTPEIPTFIHLPNPTTKNLKTTRNVLLPSKQTATKLGINIGYFKKTKENNQNNDIIYGTLVRSNDTDSAVISPEDFTRHVYAVGGTGAGKTTFLREIAKHLEMLNLNKQFPNSFIYLDPKGDDSYKFIQQCQIESIKKGMVNFLDPIKTNFSINPLELPRYNPNERQETVSRYVGYFMEIVKEWYHQQQSFVQMERIFRVLLYYMYLNNDAPTFLDMYEIVTKLQSDGESFLQTMFKALGMPAEELKQALKSIAGLKADSFVPLLNRVEQFATDPILKRVFCVRHGTVSFEELLRAGQYTIVRISTLHIPHHVQPLAIQAFVIKLWFTIQERAARIEDEQKRNHVILAIDEFQIVKDLQVLPMILSQARSYKLGLMLAHQTTAQISENLLEEITGNCATQLAGRVSGRDATRIANIWDPKFSKEIQQQLASQEDFHWTIKMRASPGEEQPTPVQFWLHWPMPKLNLDENQIGQFIEEQQKRYGHTKTSNNEQSDDYIPLLQQKVIQKNQWLRYLTVEIPKTKQHWKILLILHHNGSLNLTEITKKLQASSRDDVSELLQEMIQKELINPTKIENQRQDFRNWKYTLSEKSKKDYFTFDYDLIGKADDIPKVAKKAIQSYLKKGFFVTLAAQKVEKEKQRTDLIAYSFDDEKSISVEIESASEVLSHPEHVRYNMTKWKEMGLDSCHVWSANPKIQEIYDSQLDEDDKKDVSIFVVD